MTDPAPVRDLPPVRPYPIGVIRESPENPRVISQRAVELVAGSLRRFGWKQPVVVDRGADACSEKAPGELLVGHTRFRAAKTLGLTHVPGISAEDLTEEEAKAYRIADNRTGDFTTWDLPALTQQLEALADGFADVLALADWEDVLNRYTDMQLPLPPEVENAITGGFIITVHFQTKEQALKAEQAIFDLPGVFDVRHDTV
jgi:hypothetical protein